MPKYPRYEARRLRKAYRAASLLAVVVCFAATTSSAATQELPAGGTTTWVIDGVEEIVTFVLFDPKASGVSLPAGLRFVLARDVPMPEIQEHLEQHPDHAEWAFSFVEITRSTQFTIDGKSPTLPKDGGIGLWFAPVDASQLAAEVPAGKFDAIIAPSTGSVLALGIWVPDREYVEYMNARGHHAEFGIVTLVKDSGGEFRGEIQLDNLQVRGSASPHGDVREEPEGGTQVLFAPGEAVTSAVVVAAPNGGRHRDCTAQWSKEGSHPLSGGVFVGPTYFTTYDAPLKGSAYWLRDRKER